MFVITWERCTQPRIVGCKANAMYCSIMESSITDQKRTISAPARKNKTFKSKRA
jgi:hypothetical protein